MHLPAVHICPVGHTAPAQASTQLPLTQDCPAEQVIFSHPESTHLPVDDKQA